MVPFQKYRRKKMKLPDSSAVAFRVVRGSDQAMEGVCRTQADGLQLRIPCLPLMCRLGSCSKTPQLVTEVKWQVFLICVALQR